MKLVSFSLYGDDPKYLEGAVKNALYISENMPGWNAVFYVGKEVSADVSARLIALGATVKLQEPSWHQNGMFWRFKVFHDFSPEIALIRDTDSRITPRELLAVSEWINSKKMVHIMRDHPHHNVRILGGMWGGTGRLAIIIPEENRLLEYGNARGQDQVFLGDYLYPLVRKDLFVHDSFYWINFKKHRFSRRDLNGEYIGESFDADDSHDPHLRQIAACYESRPLKLIMLNLRYLKAHSSLIRWIRDFVAPRCLDKSDGGIL
jgi:hypothetical protein